MDDADCGVGRMCREAVCLCAEDRACPPGTRCNVAGSCQRPPACRTNFDCPSGDVCDPDSGLCVVPPTCPSDLHCPIGAICVDERCQSGCRYDADCRIGEICLWEGDSGRCDEGCRETRECPLGGLCVGDRCFDRPIPGLCQACGGPDDCVGSNDWCLENRSYDRSQPERGARRQCASDCNGASEACPNGTLCRPVVARVWPSCRTSADCGNGELCAVDEGDTVGRCLCRTDRDCYEHVPPFCNRFGFCEVPAGRPCSSAADCESTSSCGPFGPAGQRVCFRDRSLSCSSGRDCQCLSGSCALSGRPCTDSEACVPRCEQGGCVMGAGCVPEDGIFCPQLR